MQRRLFAAFLVPLLAACAAVGPTQGARVGSNPSQASNVGILVGQRYFDQGDWEPLEDQTAFEVEYDTYGRYEPLGFEAGFSYSKDSGTQSGAAVDSRMWELYAGARKTFALLDDRLHPYISAGASFLDADATLPSGGSTAPLSDSTFGFYLRAGVYYTFGGGLNLGLDYRKLLGTKLEDSGTKTDADFDQVGVLIGYSF